MTQYIIARFVFVSRGWKCDWFSLIDHSLWCCLPRHIDTLPSLMYSFVIGSFSAKRNGLAIPGDTRPLRATLSCPPEMAGARLRSEPPHRPVGVDVRQWRGIMSDLNELDQTQSLVTVIRR